MPEFSLLTNHGEVLLRIAGDSNSRIEDLARVCDGSERAARRVVSDLLDAGLVLRRREGGRDVFAVHPDLPLVADRRGDPALLTLFEGVATRASGVHTTRREQVTAKLLGAVERLAEQGSSYPELTVDRLLSEAQLSRSTFYTYFADKGDLLQALAADVLETLWDSATYWWEREAITREELREAMQRIIDAYVEHRVVMRAVIETTSSNAAVRERYAALMERSTAQVARHIVRGQEAGYINRSLDPEPTAMWLNSMADGGLHSLVADTSERERERLGDAMAGVFWNALYADAA